MADDNQLIADLKQAIRKSVNEVCDQHNIEESNIDYDLKLKLTFPIQDEVIKTKE